ncbi:hypothetical protein XANCAGTX0491_009633 [Xanthoria calcicola]
MYLKAISLLLYYLTFCRAARTSKQPCQDVFFTFNVTSTIKNVSPQHPDLSVPGSIDTYRTVLTQRYATAPNTTRDATYTLAGVYCPVTNPGRSPSRLQLLAHGSSYTKEYWDRGAWGSLPLTNSWTEYARSRSYSTLTIDRLCNGASSHPDTQLDCQLSTSTEVLHKLVSVLRAGNASTGIPVPETLTYVGHSAGSIAGANLAQAYPEDIDTLVLTGYPSGPIATIGAAAYYAEQNLSVPASSPPSPFAYRPAYLADPKRFSGLDQGYFASTNASARQSLYAGDYDPSFPEKDYVTRGSSPLGESSFTGVLSFDAFKGPVVVVTGDLDGAAWADRDAIARTKARFPAAARFEWVRVPQTGHDVNFHRAAPRAFARVFGILNDVMTAV